MTYQFAVGVRRPVPPAFAIAGALALAAVTLIACVSAPQSDSASKASPPGALASADPRVAPAPPASAPASPLTPDSSRGEPAPPAGQVPPAAAGAASTSSSPAGVPETGSPRAGPAEQRLTAATRAQTGTPPPTREVVIPSGTTLRVKLSSDVGSDSSQVEDVVRGTLEAPISVGGEVVVPPGATVRGAVVSVQRSGKVKGRASIALRFDRLSAYGDDYDLRTDRISRQAQATKGKDAKKIGIGAGAGAVIGAIAGGGKGAAIGSAVGAGAGSGAVVATRGDEVRLLAGTTLTTKLREPVRVIVSR